MNQEADPQIGAVPPGAPPSAEAGSGAAGWVRWTIFGADGLRAGWSLVLFVLIITALIIPGNKILGRFAPAKRDKSAVTQRAPEQTVRSVVVSEAGLFLIVALSTWSMSRIERRPMAAYGIGVTRGGGRQFASGLAWGLVFLSLLVLILKFTGLLVFDQRLLGGGAALRYGAEWGVAFLLVALFEEYLLRGFLQFTLARGLSGLLGALGAPRRDLLGFWLAALLFSFVFGFGHRSNTGESPIGLWAAGLVGLVFCLSLWRTGSLWWAIGFHASWDWAQSFLYGVADSGTMMQHHLLASRPVGRPLLSGGLTGPEGSLFVLPVLLGVTAVIALQLRRKEPQVSAATS